MTGGVTPTGESFIPLTPVYTLSLSLSPILSPTQQRDVSVMRADSQAGKKVSKQGKQATLTGGSISYYYVTVHFTVHLHHLNSYYKNQELGMLTVRKCIHGHARIY